MSRHAIRAAKGLCSDCANMAMPGKKWCISCSQTAKRERAQKKQNGECTDLYCVEKAAAGKTKCPRHVQIQNVSDRKRLGLNPERVMWHNARYRAKVRGVPFTIVPEDIVIGSHCPVLGIPLVPRRELRGRQAARQAPSIDCFIPSLGYVPSNICVISWRANDIKSDATLAELEQVTAWMRKRLTYAAG